nr:MAG TPA: hypothetical protein [Caudoviricetes sp.]
MVILKALMEITLNLIKTLLLAMMLLLVKPL